MTNNKIWIHQNAHNLHKVIVIRFYNVKSCHFNMLCFVIVIKTVETNSNSNLVILNEWMSEWIYDGFFYRNKIIFEWYINQHVL